METTEEPSSEWDVISWMPLTPATASSMGLVISVSISVGFVPLYWVTTVTRGKSTSGLSSSGSREKATTPRTRNAATIIRMTTGRAMARRVNPMSFLLF